MKKVLVTGACGWIGQQVCSYLTEQRISVVGSDIFQRSEINYKMSEDTDYVQLDITKPIDIEVSNIDAVIHCAGYAHRPNETAEEQKMFYAVNRDGTKNVLDWCERAGVKRFLYVSSIAFYDWNVRKSENVSGESLNVNREDAGEIRECGSAGVLKCGNGKERSEEDPVSLPTHYAKSKYEGEQLVVNSSLDWRVVRLSTVFGDGDRANFSRMASAMKKHLFPIPGKGSARKSVIPVQLAAELIARFALMDHPPHQLINLGLPQAPSLNEICKAYHSVCGLPKCPSIPMPLIKSLALCGDLVTKMLGESPFNSKTLNKLTTSTEVSTQRMLECFPNYDFDSFADYLMQCKEWYRTANLAN